MNLHSSITPRRWQMEALKVWAEEFSGVVSVVTGGGKTVFSYLCIKKFFREFPDGRAIIVVPTLSLLDQWFVDICDATDLDETQIACYSGENHAEVPARINILVLNTARRMSRELAEYGPSILVVDECHRTGAVENSLALQGTHEATLGLSATPERDADNGFDSRIAPVLGPIVYTYGYRDARADRVIVDFNLVNVDITLDHASLLDLPIAQFDISVLDGGHTEISKTPDSNEQALVNKLTYTAESVLRIPWAVKLALAHRSERIIIFHERVACLSRISALLSHYDQNAVAYHSRLSEPHRRDNLRLFRRGMVNILVTCRALDEGANVPETNVAIIAHSTRSTRQRIQRLGRVLRPAPDKSHAFVYTLFRGDDQRFCLAREARMMDGIGEVIWKRGTIR